MSIEQWDRLNSYIAAHPAMPVLDPLESITLLCDRGVQYELLQAICDDAGENKLTKK